MKFAQVPRRGRPDVCGGAGFVRDEMKPVDGQKHIGRAKRCSLIFVHKRIISGDAEGAGRRQPGEIDAFIGV